MRADGIDEHIQVGYRLRSYDTTAAAGNGEGSFYVEGFVQRGETTLARALLKRSIIHQFKSSWSWRLGSDEWSQPSIEQHRN